jgi:hypothetical protein
MQIRLLVSSEKLHNLCFSPIIFKVMDGSKFTLTVQATSMTGK